MIDPFKFDSWHRSVCGCRRLFIPHRIDEQTWAGHGRKSCDDFRIAASGPNPRIDFRDEHIASRKGWVRYVYLKTAVNRAAAEETDDFIAHLQTRLEQAKRRS